MHAPYSQPWRSVSPPARSERVRRRVAERVQVFEAKAAQSSRKRLRALLFLYRVAGRVFRRWSLDKCPQQAASLSFQTVLSIVPALAVVLAAFRATGAMEAESRFVEFLSRELIPLSRQELSARLLHWSENVTFESLGLVGLVSTLLIAFVAFNGLEKSVNHIWRVRRKRRLFTRLAVFYLSATFGPLLFGLSLYHAARFGLAEGWSGFLLSVVSTYAGLVLANLMLPATRVHVVPALIGALVTTVLAEVAKFAFGAYVSSVALPRYVGIYGAVAAVPLWLMWIYWSWMMFFLGIEVTRAVQSIRKRADSDGQP